MPAMPFLSRRRSALDVLTNNLRDNGSRDNDEEASARPQTSGLAVPSPTTARSARPVSVHGMAFVSSRLSREVRREDIPDSPTHEQEKRRSKRFSMLKMRNFSETQISSLASQRNTQEDIPPMPPLPPGAMGAPSIVRTAPTTQPEEEQVRERKQVIPSFFRSSSRKTSSEPQTATQPRFSIDEPTAPATKKSSLRWRKRQGKSTTFEDLLQISAARSKSGDTPPAYGEHGTTDLAVPVPRFSESSRSEGSSGDHIYGSTTTTHTVSTHTTFFKIPRRNKNRNSLFPPPVALSPPRPSEDDANRNEASSVRQSSDDRFGARSPPLTALQRARTGSSPSRRNTGMSTNGQSTQSPLSRALQTGHSLVRQTSQRSRKSTTSSPLQPPGRLGMRERASTASSFPGRISTDTPPLISGSTRNSTSTTGRSSLGGLLNLSRFRQDSDLHSSRHDSQATSSKANSFAISREALVVPEREEGDTPGKYLEKLEATISRSMIATVLSKSADPFEQAVLRSYTRRFAFFGEPIDMSLRKFLLEAELPKETQQVDRVIQAFADRYHECNPGVFMSPDQAYIIAFSLMMLHTDAFNKNNKRKMQKVDYIKNTSGQHVSDDVLGCLYDNICYTPFVHYEEEVDVNGERVLPFGSKKSKIKGPTAEGKKPSGPVDPYTLLIEQRLDTLRPAVGDSITMEDPYQYMGSSTPLDMKFIQRAFTHTGVLQIISARSRPTAYEDQLRTGNPNPMESEAGIINLKVTKVGVLWRKAARKKKARSPWQEWGVILTGSQLYLFKNAHWAKSLMHQFVTHQRFGTPRTPVIFKPPISDFKPDALIKTDDAVALVDSTYTRHKHAFTFVRHGGQEEVLLADNDTERNDWLAMINYAAAFRAAGVRIRGMLGINEEVQEARRPSVTSTTSTSGQNSTNVTNNDRANNLHLQKQVLAARRQVMMQRIVQADREVAQMSKQLEDHLRDARHLQILAPIAQKTREDVIFGAARADASIKWIRRDIWRIKAHRDILALDVQEDGIGASELQTMIAKLAIEYEKAELQTDGTGRDAALLETHLSPKDAAHSPTRAFATLTRRKSTREAVDEYMDDVFRSPPEHAKAGEMSQAWSLPPLQLDVTESERLRPSSVGSVQLSLTGTASSRRTSLSRPMSSSAPRQDHLNIGANGATIRAVTPVSSIAGTDNEDGVAPSATSGDTAVTRPSDVDAAPRSPESTNKRQSVRRSLQKTLRDVPHPSSSQKHKRGKDSESTVRSGGNGETTDAEAEGTPGLERGKGRFILHGKQASVIEFGEDWTKDRMKMRRDAWRDDGGSGTNTPRTQIYQASRGGPTSPLVQRARSMASDNGDDHDEIGSIDEATASSVSSAAQSFVESAERVQGHTHVETGNVDTDSSDDDQLFYDLSTWDPDTGRRSTIVNALTGFDPDVLAQSDPGAEGDKANNSNNNDNGVSDTEDEVLIESRQDDRGKSGSSAHAASKHATVAADAHDDCLQTPAPQQWIAERHTTRTADPSQVEQTCRAIPRSRPISRRVFLESGGGGINTGAAASTRSTSTAHSPSLSTAPERAVRGLTPHATLVNAVRDDRREKIGNMVPLADHRARRGSSTTYNSHYDNYDGADDDERSDVGSAQTGVRLAEAISSTWTRWDLYIAYFGLSLLAFATSLEGLTTTNLQVYATSAYRAHSLISTVLVVQGVVLAVVKPPMSKIADVFGRFEAFSLSVVIYTLGYVQQAASNSVESFAAAQIFYSAGQTGLQILIQIFIADTSDLVNRALCATLPYAPYLVNSWLGAPLASLILEKVGWRWGYGIWAVVLPVAFLPLALALVINQRAAARKGLAPCSPFEGLSWIETTKHLWYELDFFGLALLCGAFSLILIPLSLASNTGWDNPNIITLLVLGGVCLIIFPFWETNKYLAPRAFFPAHLFTKRTVLAGLGISFFYFMAYYMSVFPYFQSYLLVVQDKSVSTSGLIVQTWTFASTVTSICVSLAIKHLKRYRLFVTCGACIYVVGLFIMVLFRTENASTLALVASQIMVGAGGGMLNIPAQTGVQASASHQEVAAATAIFLTFLEIGGACGSAISGAVWSASVPKKLMEYLPDETKDQAAAIYGNITLAATGWPMGDPTRQAINRAYQETMTRILMIAVCVAVPVVLLSLFMEDYKLDEIDQHVKGLVIGGEVDDHSPDVDDDSGLDGPSARTRLLAEDTNTHLDGKGKGKRPTSNSRFKRS